MDLFQPMPDLRGTASKTWGEASVVPRDIHNGIEDPVIWKDDVQCHLIVNDWQGRIAWYQRSKDGVNWTVEPGEAYQPGIAVHENGTKEDWCKYELIRILQDSHGRAIAANFAVIDYNKRGDLASDDHSSKLIVVPLTVGRLLTVLDDQPITDQTKFIRLKIHAEPGFDPHTDVDLGSLRFGAWKHSRFFPRGHLFSMEQRPK